MWHLGGFCINLDTHIYLIKWRSYLTQNLGQISVHTILYLGIEGRNMWSNFNSKIELYWRLIASPPNFQTLRRDTLGEVVAQLVECSPINLLACASVGSNTIGWRVPPIYHSDICMWVPPIYHNYYVKWCLTGSSAWVSSGHSGVLPQLSGKWLNDYEIGYSKDQAP